MKRLLLASVSLAVLACLTITYGAGTTANASWTAPTAYTDGSALPASDIDHYTISWAPASGQLGPSGSLQVAGAMTAAAVPVACGTVSFTVSVTTTTTAMYPNSTSGQSNAVPYASGVTCSPNPPTGLAVN